MAAKTPDTVSRYSLGSTTLLIGTFSTTNIDNGDTWTTGLGTSAKHVLTNSTLASATLSSGVITFKAWSADQLCDVWILADA